MSIADAKAKAESELPFKDAIEIKKKPPAPSTRLIPLVRSRAMSKGTSYGALF